MNQSQIPVRYARALLLLGKDKGILGQLSTDIKRLSELFANNPKLIPWLRSPIVKMQDKKDLFRNQFKNELSEFTYRFIDLVISKKRERFFLAIFRDFIDFYKKEAGIKTLILTTAIEIDEVIKQKMSLTFAKNGNKKHELITRIKPSIIGGFMLQADDLLYDASISGELKKLKKELTGQLMDDSINYR